MGQVPRVGRAESVTQHCSHDRGGPLEGLGPCDRSLSWARVCSGQLPGSTSLPATNASSAIALADFPPAFSITSTSTDSSSASASLTRAVASSPPAAGSSHVIPWFPAAV
jgi:hypothetical protein